MFTTTSVVHSSVSVAVTVAVMVASSSDGVGDGRGGIASPVPVLLHP